MLWTIGSVVALGSVYGALHDSDPQGEENAYCDKVEQETIDGSGGMSVSFHTTACTPLGTSVVTYLYLHPTGKVPRAADLAFRYSASDDGDGPRISWADRTHVLVEVDRPGSISKILTEQGPIQISYRLGGRGRAVSEGQHRRE